MWQVVRTGLQIFIAVISVQSFACIFFLVLLPTLHSTAEYQFLALVSWKEVCDYDQLLFQGKCSFAEVQMKSKVINSVEN